MTDPKATRRRRVSWLRDTLADARREKSDWTDEQRRDLLNDKDFRIGGTVGDNLSGERT